jgi:23S rRNA pseudouridine1911/1915/1917 synthase
MKPCVNEGLPSKMEILFEDNHLLVVNKTAGLLTQPSGTDQLSLEQLCKNYLKEKYQKPGNVFLEAVHRLDKPVSGIVVFGRTSKALARLQSFIREKNCKKKYLALVEKEPRAHEEVLEHYLLHEEHFSSIVGANVPNAKKARLHYRYLGKKNEHFLLEIELETGRYHQIRVQLAAIGCPIVGDEKYGAKTLWEGSTIALHHYHISIQHPITQNILSFQKDPLWIDNKSID